MEQNVQKMSIDIINDIPQGEDSDFSIIRIRGLSDGYNTHKFQISNEVLKRDAHTVLGKFIVSKLEKDWMGKLDSTGHEPDEVVVGYIPKDSEIRFVDTSNGTFWEVDGVISKLYSGGMIDIFRRDGNKQVSCEFTAEYEDKEQTIIKSYNIRGITILGSGINASCKLANAEIIKFSEIKAEEFYHKNNNSVNELKKFAEKRKLKLADKKENYHSNLVDTSKESIDMGDWNGDKAKEDLLKEKNFDSIGKKVCLDFKGGERIKENCKYPVMNLKDGKWVYNAEGLSSAKAYGEQHDKAVADKAIAIQKKLGLYKDEGSNKMADIQGREAWGMIIKKIESHEKKKDGDKVYVESINDKKGEIIFTKNGEKFVVKAKIEVGKDDKSMDATIDWNSVKKDSEQKMSDENDKDKENKDDKQEKKMSSDANVDSAAYAEMLNKESERNAKLAKDLEDKNDIIMKYEVELSELRKFKSDKEEETKMAEVSQILAQVKDKISNEEFAKCEKEATECKLAELPKWKNDVYAMLGAKAIQFSEKETNNEDSHIRMNFFQDSKKDKNLWDRL